MRDDEFENTHGYRCELVLIIIVLMMTMMMIITITIIMMIIIIIMITNNQLQSPCSDNTKLSLFIFSFTLIPTTFYFLFYRHIIIKFAFHIPFRSSFVGSRFPLSLSFSLFPFLFSSSYSFPFLTPLPLQQHVLLVVLFTGLNSRPAQH